MFPKYPNISREWKGREEMACFIVVVPAFLVLLCVFGFIGEKDTGQGVQGRRKGDFQVQGLNRKSARTAATVTDAKNNYPTTMYQRKKDLSREG